VILHLTVVVVVLIFVKQISCYYDISDGVSATSTLSKWIGPHKNMHFTPFLSHTMQRFSFPKIFYLTFDVT